MVPSTSGKPQSFNFANILSLAIDPQDNEAIYAGTEKNSLFYSYNTGFSWYIAKSLGKREVRDVKVSPLYKCNIYVASENKIFKSIDCNRSWEEIYYDNEKAVTINTIAIDPINAAIVYAGTSRGDLINSKDYGQSWAVLKRFESGIKKDNASVIKILVNSKNPADIFVATDGYGLYKSDDYGRSWVDFNDSFKKIEKKDALKIKDIALSETGGKTVLAATKAGLLRSYDSGNHWHLVELLPPADKANINAVAFSPQDKETIYYTTNTTFGFSKDGGKSWTSKKLPSSRVGSALLVDHEKPEVVYLGVRTVEN